VLLPKKLPVQEEEMHKHVQKEQEKLQGGEDVQVVLGEELHEELAGDLQEDVPQYDAKPPPFFIPISLNYFEI